VLLLSFVATAPNLLYVLQIFDHTLEQDDEAYSTKNLAVPDSLSTSYHPTGAPDATPQPKHVESTSTTKVMQCSTKVHQEVQRMAVGESSSGDILITVESTSPSQASEQLPLAMDTTSTPTHTPLKATNTNATPSSLLASADVTPSHRLLDSPQVQVFTAQRHTSEESVDEGLIKSTLPLVRSKIASLPQAKLQEITRHYMPEMMLIFQGQVFLGPFEQRCANIQILDVGFRPSCFW
jgi:hypothetical protein